MLSRPLLGHSLLEGSAPCTLLPRLTWVTSPYTFSKLGTSSSASPRGKSSPITIIREFPSVEILKTHLDTSSREPSWSRVGWGDLQLCLPFYPVIIITAPGLICSSTLTSHSGSPASPVQRGGLTPVRAALPMAPRRPVAALPVAMALAHGQLGAGQGSCSPACLGWGMWGC